MTGSDVQAGGTLHTSRFNCTPAGVIASSRRRFSGFLLILALIMTVATVAMLLASRFVPALLAAGVGLVVGMAWRMSLELSPQWMEVSQGRLTVQTATLRFEVPLEGATTRELDPKEVDHLRGLASTAGLVAGVGGFDSHLLGEFDLYATDLDNSVLLESAEERLVVTPDDPAEFLEATIEAGATTRGPLLQSEAHE